MAHRIGIIGLGIMGQRMLGAMSEHPGFIAAAAWDPDPAALERLRHAHPGIAAAAAAAALAARPDLDALYIASPPASHPGHVGLAWDHGKAAFCEKPLAIGLADSEALVRRAAAEGRRAAINFPFATSPAGTGLLDAATSGELGALRSIAIEVDFAAWPRPWQQAGRWLSERAEGGFVREVVSHFLFLAQRLAGPLAVIEARTRYPDDASSAETAVEARLAAGTVPVTLRGGVGTISADDRNSLTVTGERGAMRLTDWTGLARAAGAVWQPIALGEAQTLRPRAAAAQLDQLAALIDGSSHRLATLAEGLAVQRCVEAILRNGR